MDVGIGCRHRDMEWYDNHHCGCNECGKVGEWFDDGFTLWRRASAAERDRLSGLCVDQEPQLLKLADRLPAQAPAGVWRKHA